MREGKKINGFLFNAGTQFKDLFKQRYIFGFSKYVKQIISKRLEIQSSKKLGEIRFSKNLALFKTLFCIFPQHNNVRKKHIINIFLLDVINSYRGFRHAVGLPTRGQRT